MKKNRIIYFLALIASVSFTFSPQVDAAIWDVFNPQGIPVYPVFEKTSEQKFVVNGTGIKIETYQADNISIPQAVEYYNKILIQKGWKAQGLPQISGESSTLSFSHQDGRFLQLIIFSGQRLGKPNTVYMNMTYSLEGINNWLKRSSEIDNDMPGEDIPWLKRYPGSVRTGSTSNDAGMINVSYTLLNYNCLECVAAFFKEELSKRGFRLISVVHKTKDELIKEIPSFDFEKLMEKLPEAEKEKYKNGLDTIDKNLSDKKNAGQAYNDFLPEEAEALSFQKGSEICKFTITYNNFQAISQIGQGPEAGNEAARKAMEELAKDNRLAYFANMQKQSREFISIKVTYIPKLEGQKSWF